VRGRKTARWKDSGIGEREREREREKKREREKEEAKKLEAKKERGNCGVAVASGTRAAD